MGFRVLTGLSFCTLLPRLDGSGSQGCKVGVNCRLAGFSRALRIEVER
jgi:hypothetical protein